MEIKEEEEKNLSSVIFIFGPVGCSCNILETHILRFPAEPLASRCLNKKHLSTREASQGSQNSLLQGRFLEKKKITVHLYILVYSGVEHCQNAGL